MQIGNKATYEEFNIRKFGEPFVEHVKKRMYLELGKFLTGKIPIDERKTIDPRGFDATEYSVKAIVLSWEKWKYIEAMLRGISISANQYETAHEIIRMTKEEL